MQHSGLEQAVWKGLLMRLYLQFFCFVFFRFRATGLPLRRSKTTLDLTTALLRASTENILTCLLPAGRDSAHRPFHLDSWYPTIARL